MEEISWNLDIYQKLKNDIIKTSFPKIFHKRYFPDQRKSKQAQDKTSESVLKDQIHHNKENKGCFQAVKMFISTHNSFKTTCSCILPLSVTDIMWGAELGVKCRWHTGLMSFLEFIMCFFPLLLATTLPHLWVTKSAGNNVIISVNFRRVRWLHACF